MRTLFESAPRFPGLPAEGFDTFAIPDRDARRRAILDAFHPPLRALGEDLVERLDVGEQTALHAHLPRLDWPRDYQPFCTWLALSLDAQGYQAGPQLNVGVHADHVSVRLGWDAAADRFGRFELRARHGSLRAPLHDALADPDLRLRVYAAAPWPRGSTLAFDSPHDVEGAFDEVRRRGVWWELGRRYAIPESLPRVTVPEFCREAARTFEALLPLYLAIVGERA